MKIIICTCLLITNLFSAFLEPNTGWSFTQSTNQTFYIFLSPMDFVDELGNQIEGYGDGSNGQTAFESDCGLNPESCDVLGAFMSRDIDEIACSDAGGYFVNDQCDICVGWSYYNSYNGTSSGTIATTLPVMGFDNGVDYNFYCNDGEAPKLKFFDASNDQIYELSSETELGTFSNNNIYLYYSDCLGASNCEDISFTALSTNDGNDDWDGEACSMPENTIHVNDDGSVLYNSTSDIGGFQFNVDGSTVNSASGGDAAASGFTISSSATTVLAFSLTGGTIPSGCGTLVELDMNGIFTGLSGIIISDPFGESIDLEYFDGVYTDDGGEGEDQCDSQVCLSLDQGNLNYSSTEDIAGFQFNHDGCITSAFGGDAADNGFTISSSASAVLAFSFSGSVIPQGSGTLIELTGNISEDCLSGFIFSDYSGEELSVEFGEPLSDDGGVDTCEDSNACNFGQEGDCEYPEEFFDCNGNCIVNVDCEGVCGGDAVIDDCGECNGNNDCIDAGNLLYVSDINDYGDGNVAITIGYSFEDAVAGFQFDLLTDGVFILESAEGEVTSEAGFIISTSSSGTIIGFSLTGQTIAAGSGDFVTLWGTYDTANIGTTVSFYAVEDCESDGAPDCNGPNDTRMVLSDTSGSPLESAFIPGCWTVGEAGDGSCDDTSDDGGVILAKILMHVTSVRKVIVSILRSSLIVMETV